MKRKKIFLFLFTICSFVILANFSNSKAEEKSNANFLTLPKNPKKMTYDEILSEMVKDGIPKEKALSLLGKRPTASLLRTEHIWYTTIEDTVTVTWGYKVRPKFYIKAEGGHGVYFIRQVLSASLDRSYYGTSKLFSGNLYYNLESRTRLYYRLDGDFYDNGTISISGGGSVGLSQWGSLNFSVSYSTSHYKYIYKTGYIKFGRI